MTVSKKWAVVFVADPHCDPPKAWNDEEYEKANRFIEGLMAWEYQEDHIYIIGDSTRFYHGVPLKMKECLTDGNPYDYLGEALGDIQLITDIEHYCLWISDDCPLITDIPNNPKLNIKQHGKLNTYKEHDKFDPTNGFTEKKITAHLEFMKDVGCQKTVIFSGKGSGNMAMKIHEHLNIPEITLIASSPGDVDYDNPPGNIDHFNIGIVMPQVPKDDFKGTDGAYWAEVARLNGIQSPLMWPSQD